MDGIIQKRVYLYIKSLVIRQSGLIKPVTDSRLTSSLKITTRSWANSIFGHFDPFWSFLIIFGHFWSFLAFKIKGHSRSFRAKVLNLASFGYLFCVTVKAHGIKRTIKSQFALIINLIASVSLIETKIIKNMHFDIRKSSRSPIS